MPSWHYSQDGRQLGPISEGELKQLVATGRLRPTDLVWQEGMSDWQTAQTVAGLFPPKSPPPLPPPIPTTDSEKAASDDMVAEADTVNGAMQYDDAAAEAAWRSRNRPLGGQAGILDAFLQKTIKQFTCRHKASSHKQSPTGIPIKRDHLLNRLKDLYAEDGFHVTVFDSALVVEKVRTGADYFTVKTGNDPFANVSTHANAIIRIMDAGQGWMIDISAEAFFWPRVLDQLMASLGLLCLALIFFWPCICLVPFMFAVNEDEIRKAIREETRLPVDKLLLEFT